MITVQVADKNGILVPTDNSEIKFSIVGPGKIIGVGNGDPSSHEADRYFETITISKIENLKELAVGNLTDRPETGAAVNDSAWKPAFYSQRSDDWRVYADSLLVIRGSFELQEFTRETEINLMTKSIVENQSVYVNGHLIASAIKRDAPNQLFRLDHAILVAGKNIYAVTGQRFRKKQQWDEPNTDPGLVQIRDAALPWKRHVFNGFAQVIVQSTGQPGEITLIGSASGLQQAALKIRTEPVARRASVPGE